jgi:hypothetical protein
MTADSRKKCSKELFEFLNMLRRANDRLVLSDYFDGKGYAVRKRIDDFKARVRPNKRPLWTFATTQMITLIRTPARRPAHMSDIRNIKSGR